MNVLLGLGYLIQDILQFYSFACKVLDVLVFNSWIVFCCGYVPCFFIHSSIEGHLCCFLFACCVLPLLCLGICFVSLISPRLLSWKGVGLCQRLFQDLMGWLYSLLISVCLYGRLGWYILIYWTFRISGMKPTWSYWMMFMMFFGFSLWVFYWVFLGNVGMGNWSKILFV